MNHAPRSLRITRTILAVAALAIVGHSRAFDAQGPERQHEGNIPGTELPLKAGWKRLVYHECRFAVPASWRPNEDASLVTAPDGSNVSIRTFKIPSWSAHKSQILNAFGRVRVLHENSDHRLWFEIGDPPRIQHFIDVSVGASVCNALLEVRGSTLTFDDVTRMADSIGPAKPPHEYAR